MFRGFNLKINDDYNKLVLQNYMTIGKNLLEEQKEYTGKELKEYIDNGGILNATLIEKDWFPSIDSHIFISHSHINEDIAIGLVGFLQKEFGLKCFVDSCVWKYSNDLLKNIDDQYCKFENEQTYDYNKRNNSTAHVHNILSMALSKMIDKTECLFFLNTPNSVPIVNTITEEEFTFSPWIYLELKISDIIRKKLSKERQLVIQKTANYSEDIKLNSQENLIMKYPIGTKHLVNLNMNDISKLPIYKDEPYKTLNHLYSRTDKQLKEQLKSNVA